MKLILGLGNPGDKYSKTRHNCGFLVTDKVAAFFSLKLRKRCFHLYKQALLKKDDDKSTVLVQPLTYMNNSGEILKNFKDLDVNNLIVICDQMDLPVGNIRIKRGGGHAGHNGLKSIINNLNGSKNFIRLYVGIGRPKENESVVDHVLGIEEDWDSFEKGIDKAVEAAIDLINDNAIENVMQKYNSKTTHKNT